MPSKNILNWPKIEQNEDGYYIYRSTSTIPTDNLPTPVATLIPGTYTWTDPNEYTTRMYYRVGIFKNDTIKVSSEVSFLPITQDTGPGAQILSYSNGTDGYFGSVTAANLINTTNLSNLVGVTGFTSEITGTNQDTPWMKVLMGNKVLFIAKLPGRVGMRADYMDDLGIRTGERLIEIGNYQYRVRLLKGFNVDKPTPTGSATDNPLTHGSEWNRLMYNLCSEVPPSQNGVNWEANSLAQLGLANSNTQQYCAVQETVGDSITLFTRGSFSTISTFASNIAISNAIWRPVLELVTY